MAHLPSRIVLLLPTDGYRASAFIAAATTLGVEVVVATEAAPPMASVMEDRLVVVDFDRPEASAAKIAALAQRLPVDAVVGVDDRGVLTAAHASDLLGLVHNPADAVAATRDKAEMRSVFAAWSVPQPRFRVAGHGADVTALAVAVGFPCVIKPVSLSASVGVIRVDSSTEVADTAQRVRDIAIRHGRSPHEPLMIEQFVAGAEVSLEGLMSDGGLDVLALFDKPDPLDGPFFEETLYVTPSRLSAAQQDAVVSAASAGCRALGITQGPVHAEMRVGNASDGAAVPVWVIEVAARSIGGLCSRVLSFGTDVTLEELILRNALRVGTEGLRVAGGASAVMMIPIPRSGRLVDVRGVDAARRIPGVTGVEITATRGRLIETLPDDGRYLGFVFARGDTPAAVEAVLRRAHAALTVDIAAIEAAER